MKGKRRAQIVDITVRMRRKDGRRVSAQLALKALWAAHKIAQHGGSLEAELREWELTAIDWRNGSRRYQYFANLTDVLGSMGGILETVGMDGLRVAVVDRTGER